MTLHIAVVAHHSRQPRAERLATQLDAELFLDHLTLGSGWNHLRALNWGSQLTGHLLVLEDDAEPCNHFITHTAAAIAEHPDDLISYYLGTDTRPHQKHIPTWLDEAHEQDRNYLTHNHLLHGVAYSIPCHRIPTLHFNTKRVADDMVDRAWKGRVIYTIPSHVDHADEPSIENQPRRPRKAWTVCGSAQ